MVKTNYQDNKDAVEFPEPTYPPPNLFNSGSASIIIA